MSLIPLLFDYDPWELRRYHTSRSHQLTPWDHLGLGITPSEIELITIPSLLMQDKNLKKSNNHEITVGKDGFQVHMNVQQFKPNEITVKTHNDCVVVEGKHEDRQDEHGYISRHFVRKYKLPKGYDPNQVASSLSSDGVLTIKAPLPANALENKERIVQIQQTDPAHLNVKENKAEAEEKKDTKQDKKK